MIVTGASRGIGAATALLAARRGYAICVNYRTARSAAERIVDHVNAAGGQAIAVPADVSVEADVERLFRTCDDELPPLVGLVNNAGILERQMSVREMDAARLHRILATNVVGAFIARGKPCAACPPRTAAAAARS